MRGQQWGRMGLVIGVAVVGAAMAATTAAQQQQRQRRVDLELTSAGPVAVHEFATGLEHPWGAVFLPDGRMLVTERPGRLRIVDRNGALSDPVDGTPQVFARGQGGLMDIALDPAFDENQFIYLAYAKPGPDEQAATALGRGRWVDDRIEDFQDIFVQEPWVRGGNHFGVRIVFSGEMLFLVMGDRFQFAPAQDLDNHIGKIVRLNRDGSAPQDNPFVDQPGARPEIWSFGHRNIEAAAINPADGTLWVVEMGPLGGDELNQPEAGRNHGWPLVSWGINYDGTPIPDPPTRPELTDAVHVWTPVISPSGMVFYTGDVFEAWRGSAFIGGLSSQAVIRIRIDNGKVIEEERIPLPGRIREVEQGPDGLLYLLTDSPQGAIWQVRPLQ